MKRTFPHIIIFIFVITLASASCSVERKLAKDFIQNKDTLSVLLLMPDYVFKTNTKAWEIEGFENLSEWEQDSALYENSIFLKQLDDEFLISRFLSALQTGLRKYGINAYTQDQLLHFLDLETTSYKVSLAQMEVEEDIFPYRAEEVFYDTLLFYEDFDLNMVNINSWFEITQMNKPDVEMNVLYASHYVMDGLEGRFANNLFTGEIKFHYNLFPIKVEDIYTLAARLGDKYAGYIYDYLLNAHIHRNFPVGDRPRNYFTWNPNTRTLSPARDDRFIFMD